MQCLDIAAVTWNQGGGCPDSLYLFPTAMRQHHLIFVGVQESCRTIAKSLVYRSKKEWVKLLLSNIGPHYKCIGCANLTALHLCVFARLDVLSSVKAVRPFSKRFGMLYGTMGNKGAVGIALSLLVRGRLTTVVAVNAHLHSGDSAGPLRAADCALIAAAATKAAASAARKASHSEKRSASHSSPSRQRRRSEPGPLVERRHDRPSPAQDHDSTHPLTPLPTSPHPLRSPLLHANPSAPLRTHDSGATGASASPPPVATVTGTSFPNVVSPTAVLHRGAAGLSQPSIGSAGGSAHLSLASASPHPRSDVRDRRSLPVGALEDASRSTHTHDGGGSGGCGGAQYGRSGSFLLQYVADTPASSSGLGLIGTGASGPRPTPVRGVEPHGVRSAPPPLAAAADIVVLLGDLNFRSCAYQRSDGWGSRPAVTAGGAVSAPTGCGVGVDIAARHAAGDRGGGGGEASKALRGGSESRKSPTGAVMAAGRAIGAVARAHRAAARAHTGSLQAAVSDTSSGSSGSGYGGGPLDAMLSGVSEGEFAALHVGNGDELGDSDRSGLESGDEDLHIQFGDDDDDDDYDDDGLDEYGGDVQSEDEDSSFGEEASGRMGGSGRGPSLSFGSAPPLMRSREGSGVASGMGGVQHARMSTERTASSRAVSPPIVEASSARSPAGMPALGGSRGGSPALPRAPLLDRTSSTSQARPLAGSSQTRRSHGSAAEDNGRVDSSLVRGSHPTAGGRSPNASAPPSRGVSIPSSSAPSRSRRRHPAALLSRVVRARFGRKKDKPGSSPQSAPLTDVDSSPHPAGGIYSSSDIYTSGGFGSGNRGATLPTRSLSGELGSTTDVTSAAVESRRVRPSTQSGGPGRGRKTKKNAAEHEARKAERAARTQLVFDLLSSAVGCLERGDLESDGNHASLVGLRRVDELWAAVSDGRLPSLKGMCEGDFTLFFPTYRRVKSGKTLSYHPSEIAPLHPASAVETPLITPAITTAPPHIPLRGGGAHGGSQPRVLSSSPLLPSAVPFPTPAAESVSGGGGAPRTHTRSLESRPSGRSGAVKDIASRFQPLGPVPADPLAVVGDAPEAHPSSRTSRETVPLPGATTPYGSRPRPPSLSAAPSFSAPGTSPPVVTPPRTDTRAPPARLGGISAAHSSSGGPVSHPALPTHTRSGKPSPSHGSPVVRSSPDACAVVSVPFSPANAAVAASPVGLSRRPSIVAIGVGGGRGARDVSYNAFLESVDRKRVPSWCDRVLFSCSPRFSAKVVSYRAIEAQISSDHVPVAAHLQFVILDR